MIPSTYRWRLVPPPVIDDACRDWGLEHGLSERLVRVLAARGVGTASDLERFLAPPEAGLHDPMLLPDAAATLRRVTTARAGGEKVLVCGDFDADGVTGTVILTLALRQLGLDVEPYVPDRLGDGHGLSRKAVERAVAEGRRLIVTADTGTSSAGEIAQAQGRGVDVIVTDHHHAAVWPRSAVAVVNPWRDDSEYPDRELTGAGVAWKVAHLLLDALVGDGGAGLPPQVAAMADLALIGTVADVAPILGENRCIARLGLARLATGSRPGLVALLRRAGVDPCAVDLETIGFAVAPRLNAAGRMGEAARAARLLLTEDQAEADALAAEIEAANNDRRELTKRALAEARATLGLGEPGEAASSGKPAAPGDAASSSQPATAGALLVRGEWPVGIVGLIAGRLTDELTRPSVVATLTDAESGILRASCRAPNGFNLAEALTACQDLLIRHGGHAAAAGFDIAVADWPAFEARFLELAESAVLPSGPRELVLDLAMKAADVDFAFVKEMASLAPTGTGNPPLTLGLAGLRVVRVRAAQGGHTQLVLNRGRDVVDAIAFRRPDLAGGLGEGDAIDVVARASSRRFGGIESMQLEVIDVAPAGTLRELVRAGLTLPA